MSTCSLFLLVGTLLLSSVWKESQGNFLHGSTFEERSSRWQLRIRPNMWNFQHSQEQILISADHAHSGQRSLKMSVQESPDRLDRSLALVASQFLHMTNTRGNDSGSTYLKFQFFVKKSESTRAFARLDIRYTDRSFMFAKVPLLDLATGGSSFVRVCRTVPDYGRVESIMISFSVEPPTPGHPVYIDDVSLEYDQSGGSPESCPVYTRSFPIRRHVEANFMRPSEWQAPDASIAIATQLTTDRLENLERMAEQWQGPISAALMVWSGHNGQPMPSKQIAEAVERVASSAVLRRWVSLHLVFEDSLNEEDHYFFPVNFLRSVAVRNVLTKHVYYLDVDIVPAFNETTTADLLVESREQIQRSGTTEKWAFITPLLNMKTATRMPSSKAEALDWISAGKLEVFAVVSHSIVSYGTWMTTSTSYVAPYRDNVEPYFIIDTSYGVRMMEMFAGYGRDKCAYSREAHGMGVQFAVMHNTFAVNWKQTNRQRSIVSFRTPDGNMVQLRVFLNSFYHEKEIDVHHGGKHYPPLCSSDVIKPIAEPEVDADTADEPPYGVRCAEWMSSDSVNLEEPPHSPTRPYYRDDTVIEGLLMDFNTTVLVLFRRQLNLPWQMLVMMHLDQVMMVDSVRGGKVDIRAKEYLQSSVRGGQDLQEVVREIHAQAPGKMLFWLQDDQEFEQLQSLLIALPADAVVVIAGPEKKNERITAVCRTKSSWSAHVRGNVVVIAGGRGFRVPDAAYLPPLPDVALAKTVPECAEEVLSLDVVLFTRNRPMQLLSFFESLAASLLGVTRIVVIQRSDDELFDKGYALAKQRGLDLGLSLKVIDQNNKHFGELLLQHLKSDGARFTMFAVDEVIWLRKVDLRSVLCYMEKSNGAFASAQLRLGDQSFRARYQRVMSQSQPIASNPEFIALYPYQLPYDWGYVINVDGALMKTTDLLQDLEDLLPRIQNPSQLENAWLVKRLQRRCRQWHVSFARSYLINNVLDDGRVLSQDNPAEASRTLARKLVEDHQKVDVARFIADLGPHVSHTHTNIPVHYVAASNDDVIAMQKQEL